MDFEALKTFVTVVDQKSFTKASKILSLSQPTVSFHIKNLEDYYDTTLIDRSPKRFIVTQTGELVYQRARQVLRMMETTRSEVLEYHNHLRGSVHIGASYTVGEYILPSLLKQYDELYPGIDIKVEIANSERINQGLQNHDLDLGLVEGKVSHKGLHSTPFLEDEMVIIAPKNHSLQHLTSSTVDDLQHLTWVTRESGSGTGAMFDTMLHSYNIRPEKVITIGSNHGVVQAVKEGIGLSLLSKTVVRHTGAEQLRVHLPFMSPMKRYFSLVVQENDEEISKNAKVFIELLEQISHFKLS
ncbi:LysR family transcriptional regulator [Halobacillus yeomjeoni]|uniref:LysR substrate-binding domain-containing protein n=1 Tax=Halobacillus yeomjeoni TaxID=311194 RepID=UPI001CD3AE25|nr:LysR family transcriptional regulator [Halobacillus yeomjeoni]MCA0985030.1 LysR family transcriptional regulator [Halobacillus yeomjeoni]